MFTGRIIAASWRRSWQYIVDVLLRGYGLDSLLRLRRPQLGCASGNFFPRLAALLAEADVLGLAGTHQTRKNVFGQVYGSFNQVFVQTNPAHFGMY